jgi:cytoskeletal protein RodZ
MDRLKAWLPWCAIALLIVLLGLQIWTVTRVAAIEDELSYMAPDASDQVEGPAWAADLQQDASDAAEQARKAARRSEVVCNEVAGAFRCP